MRSRFLLCLVSLSIAATPRAESQAAGDRRASAPMLCNADTLHLAVPNAVLEGSFVCPSTPAPWPAVLLIAGSGPTDRNSNTVGFPGTNDSFRLLAEALAARGIASLRYDKRAVGRSTGIAAGEASMTVDVFADDAAAWLRRMRLDPRLSSITVMGHSEGSLVGMLAARRAGADAFVSLEGPGRPFGQVLHEQLVARAPAPLVVEADRILAQLASGKTVDSVPPALASLFRPSVQPYWISMLRHDPATELSQLSVPVLLVQGTSDGQVSVEDARRLAGAAPKAKLALIDSMSHVLKTATLEQASQMKAYTDPTLPLPAQLIDAVAPFVRSVRSP